MAKNLSVIEEVELGELKKGDEFKTIGSNETERSYIISWISPDKYFVEAYPIWDKNEEHCCDFDGAEIVQIIKVKGN